MDSTQPDLVVDTTPPEAAAWPVKSYVTGGGVVVWEGRVLLLSRRNGEVRLPKGHVEPGETEAECALREVSEETGLRFPMIVRRLGLLENRFALPGRRWIRRESWFLMTTDDPAVEKPEEQWSPEWRPLEKAEAALTFEAEKAVLRWARAAVEAGALAEG